MGIIRKNIFVFMLLIFFCANGHSQSKYDSLLVEKVCKNYLEGWYSGDANKMATALHNNLIKRRKIVLKETGGDLISQATANDMIEYTKAKYGLKENTTDDIEINILDIYNEIATVKTVTRDFVDYIHLVKFNDEWKILNVLWDVNR